MALGFARATGGYTAIRESGWRRQRLLILGYHGVSLDDEHHWDSELYIPPSLFEERLIALRDGGYRVLPLGEAVQRLYAGTLPPKAVVLTFDDGFHDFRAVVHPLLQKYDVPATVYLTTFYCLYQRPIFDIMCSYLLWKGRERTLDTAGLREEGGSVALAERGTRQALVLDIRRFAKHHGFSAEQKDDHLRELATRLGVDYDDLVRRRILQLMSPDEVAQLDPRLVQVELHTHRHRVPLDEARFRREIVDNRRHIGEVAPRHPEAVHMCYPSGVTDPAFLPWLRDLGVVSATTTVPGIASAEDDPLLLPRFLDTCHASSVEFEGWLTGIASKLPRRHIEIPPARPDGILV